MTRVNSTNVLDEGLRIGETGRRMNSKVNLVKQGGYESKRGCRTWLAFNLSHTVEGFRSIVNKFFSYGCEQESQDLI
jgi:hypothetical protein